MSGLQVDLPYPSTTDFMRDECSVRIISPAYAGGASEMTAILQYIYHAVHFAFAIFIRRATSVIPARRSA